MKRIGIYKQTEVPHKIVIDQRSRNLETNCNSGEKSGIGQRNRDLEAK